jgi:Ca2+-binding EF-hand superfamily protein
MSVPYNTKTRSDWHPCVITRDSRGTNVWRLASPTMRHLALIIVCIISSAPVFAQKPAVSIRKPSATPEAAPEKVQASSDRRDVLLLLDTGPIHLRLNVALKGVSLGESRRQVITRLMETLDKDKDGKVSRAEAAASPLFRTKQRPGASQFLDTLKAQGQITRRDVEQTIDRLGSEIIAYRQDMSSSKSDVEVFKLLDKDGSGVLDEAELASARDLIMSKDVDGDECVAFQEFIPPPPAPDPNVAAVQTVITPPLTPLATVADLVRDTTEPLLPARLLRKYDKKRDMQLDASELGWTPERLAFSDTDRNGKLDAAELGKLSTATPDVQLDVDLVALKGDGGILSIPQSSGKRLDDSGRPDYAKISFGATVITFSLRNLDPIADAMNDAMRQFNLLDVDANGYLDKDETSARTRFERGLFDMIDADNDGKLFADEMKEYVRARSEPAATSCRMNLYDTGNGFFMALDSNADGRVSVRETRQANVSLAQLDRDGKPGIGKTEPVRHFHIEFVRGSYSLFGPSEQLVAMTPAFQQRRPSGPIWFQRMDRNNDGDLTWNEFLGPRDVFHRLDTDVDSLLDPQEAAQAK